MASHGLVRENQPEDAFSTFALDNSVVVSSLDCYQLERGRTHGRYVPGDRDLCKDGSRRYFHVAGNQVDPGIYLGLAGLLVCPHCGRWQARPLGRAPYIMISTRLVKAEQLQYCVHHAGQLLHARIPHGHTHVDIVNWYQYAVNQQEGTFDRRQKRLIKLQKCIAHLPRRNSLILGGDFNCPCEQHTNVCGPAHIPPNPMYYADHSDHQQVWRTLHLTALNTNEFNLSMVSWLHLFSRVLNINHSHKLTSS